MTRHGRSVSPCLDGYDSLPPTGKSLPTNNILHLNATPDTDSFTFIFSIFVIIALYRNIPLRRERTKSTDVRHRT